MLQKVKRKSCHGDLFSFVSYCREMNSHITIGELSSHHRVKVQFWKHSLSCLPISTIEVVSKHREMLQGIPCPFGPMTGGGGVSAA